MSDQRPVPARSTTLRMTPGAVRTTITGDPGSSQLIQTRFVGRQPDVAITPGLVDIDFHRFWPSLRRRKAAILRLSTQTVWAIEFRGGVARLDADLSQLAISSIQIIGGASHAHLVLPPPTGTVKIAITGGVADLTVLHPADAPTLLTVGGGSSKLSLDDQTLGAVGSPVRVHSDSYASATDRYQINVKGGASRVNVQPSSH